MSADWNVYEPDDPGVRGLLQAMPRKEARAAFERLMAAKPSRIEALRRLLAANGVVLDRSDAEVQRLNDWFRRNVEGDPSDPGRLRPPWYAVAHDIGLFLRNLMIHQYPTLRWEFFVWGAKDISYHRPVILGFGKVPNPKYNVDPAYLVATYGHRIIASHRVEEDYFCRVLRSVGAKA